MAARTRNFPKPPIEGGLAPRGADERRMSEATTSQHHSLKKNAHIRVIGGRPRGGTDPLSQCKAAPREYLERKAGKE